MDFTKASPEDVRRICAEAVKGPGKYEGEAIYVPYFWEQDDWDSLELGAAEGWEDVSVYKVTNEDRELFPELEGRTEVRLIELQNGFVVEGDKV